MRTILRSVTFYSVALYLLPFLIPGVHITGGFATILFGGIILTVLFTIIKPVFSIITLPLNVLTLGFFSWVINIVLIYLLTVLMQDIKIQAFIFDGVRFAGFVVPKLTVSTFFAFVICALLIYSIVSFFTWLCK